MRTLTIVLRRDLRNPCNEKQTHSASQGRRRGGRLIRFDKRGTGLSDRPHDVPDLETRMHDVPAVMDAAGSRRAVLFGHSEGGPMAGLLAAVHPHRVKALILYGS